MTKISAVLPDELGATLEQRARAEDRSVSAVIRRAITEHLTTSPSLSRSSSGSRSSAPVRLGGAICDDESRQLEGEAA